jgi:hypothetical protein
MGGKMIGNYANDGTLYISATNIQEFKCLINSFSIFILSLRLMSSFLFFNHIFQYSIENIVTSNYK